MKNETIGLALPITSEMLKNLEKRDDTIFFKFMPHETFPRELGVNQKLFFYFSKKIVGEAKIKEIKLMGSSEIIKSYPNKILIRKSEFKNYIKGREQKKALVLLIEKITIYSSFVELDYYVTMGGRYIKDKEYKSWLKKVKD